MYSKTLKSALEQRKVKDTMILWIGFKFLKVDCLRGSILMVTLEGQILTTMIQHLEDKYSAIWSQIIHR